MKTRTKEQTTETVTSLPAECEAVTVTDTLPPEPMDDGSEVQKMAKNLDAINGGTTFQTLLDSDKGMIEGGNTGVSTRDSLAHAGGCGHAQDEPESDESRLNRLKPWKRVFIKQLREVPSIEKARLKAEVSRKTAYLQRDEDELFRELWDEAVEGHVDKAEESLYDLAITGDVRRTFRDGEMVSEDYKRDSQALRFLLSGNRPKTYRETHGPLVNINLGQTDDALTAALQSGALERFFGRKLTEKADSP